MDKAPKILDADAPQKVSYCIPTWARDQQILANIKRVKARIEPYPEDKRRDSPCAIICFGPSLNDTIEYLMGRSFNYLFTCSGSHKYLLEHGFDPTAIKARGGQWYHVDVDPRKHKAILLGMPHKDIEYLILSSCHKKLLDLLEGFDVKLWHAFDREEEAQRILPYGEWALSGGCSAGLRAMTIARFLGFTDLHIFGMDGNERDGVGKHAGPHPNQAPAHNLVEYPKGSGRMWKTTIAFLEAARGTFHELNQMPDVKATFYGEGLCQEMSKHYVPEKVKGKVKIAIIKPDVISPEMRELNAKLHDENVAFGAGGAKHADSVKKMVNSMICVENPIPSVLDYGCGKGQLGKALPWPIWEYDPAVPGKDESPRAADLVVCTDVLEHIEPDKLHAVLCDLRRVVKIVGYFVVHMGPAVKSYADGRNTHLIQRGKGWWLKALDKYFTVVKSFDKGKEFTVIVSPKAIIKKKVEDAVPRKLENAT